ncbi:Ktr system potassium transporter B [Desulfuromonas versatilis]|uniref:Ktr system potassium transporter B n=1 Tax=Desulfuromonas versatilis TaxID=2802975 RepID=A0ABM8HNE6_9BACT|nr:TrkH family potassium uptake protein [Desulfuromonas versatilis]BCR03001.1 Ktr system potassium transporter B [Desulfuromonas versatilis]
MGRISRRLGELTPNQALIVYYLLAILLGAFALSLPLASRQGPLPFIDGLFTATSAMCVTGLAVVDTGSRFTLFGQLTILLLIQVGGLGITTFSVYLFFYLRQGVGMRGRWIIHETLLHTPVDSLRDLVRSIFKLTLAIEAAGAVLLAFAFVPRLGWTTGVYYAIFHSVSAFCNAGFALFSDSLIGFRDDPLVNLTIMGLIILGGIGFLVMREVLASCRRPRAGGRRRLSLHSRLVLWTSLALVAGGAVLIALLEAPASFRQLPAGEAFWIALFQSVTARTAGFNTIDLNSFEAPTLFLMIFLMFVGASPGSCGGGIKTTSLALFVAILHSRLKGSAHTNVFRRTLPDELATKTLTLVMLAALFLGAATFGLLTVQMTGIPFRESGGLFLDYVFEAVSAFATVGLSLGVTPQLVPAGKLIVILLMFVGRVGLLTVAFTIIRRSREDAVRYAEENIMIG